MVASKLHDELEQKILDLMLCNAEKNATNFARTKSTWITLCHMPYAGASYGRKQIA